MIIITKIEIIIIMIDIIKMETETTEIITDFKITEITIDSKIIEIIITIMVIIIKKEEIMEKMDLTEIQATSSKKVDLTTIEMTSIIEMISIEIQKDLLMKKELTKILKI